MLRLPMASAMLIILMVGMLVSVPNSAHGASLSVNSTADVIANDGACTLREAVINANNDDQSGSTDCLSGSGTDVITLSAGTYTLAIAGINEDAAATGDLDIIDDLTINGADRNSTIVDGGGVDRVLHVLASNTVDISGVTIQNGLVDLGDTGDPSTSGGGIFNSGTLTMSNVIITRNSSSDDGGGFWNDGSLTLSNSIVTANTSAERGAGIFNFGLLLQVKESTISNNVSSTASGGGIYNARGGVASAIEITSSTINDNTAGEVGGGILHGATAPLNITNSTISGNTAFTSGGGIKISDGTTTLLNNTTVTGNTSFTGAGVYVIGRLELVNTIVANNASGSDCLVAGFGGITSLGNNVDSDNTCNLTQATDLPNIDPLIGPLQDNGGLTFTHALLVGSPAIDAGDNALCPATDQRGVVRPQGAVCDIGAFEFDVVAVPTDPDLSVTMTATPDPVGQGDNVTYEITVKNLGPGDSVEAELLIDLPFGVVVQTITPFGLSCQLMLIANDWKCTISNLAAGDSIIVQVVARVDLSSGQILTLASVTPIIPAVDVNLLNNAASVTTTASDDFDGDGIKNNVDGMKSPIDNAYNDQSMEPSFAFTDANVGNGKTSGVVFDGLSNTRRALFVPLEGPFKPGVLSSKGRYTQGRTESLDAIVIHFCVSQFGSCTVFFKNTTIPPVPGFAVGTHYVLSSRGEFIRMVEDENAAIHATYYNNRSIGIEIGGCYVKSVCTVTDQYTDSTYESLANLIAELLVRHPNILAEVKKQKVNLHSTVFAKDLASGEVVSGLDAKGCLNVPGLVGHDQIQPTSSVTSRCTSGLSSTVKSDPGTRKDPVNDPIIFDWNRLVNKVNQRMSDLQVAPVVSVKDASNPNDPMQGVIVEAMGGSGGSAIVVPHCPATVMGDFSLTEGSIQLTDGDLGMMFCGSLGLEVQSGPIEVLFGENTVLSVPAGAEITVTEVSLGEVEIENSPSSTADVTLQSGDNTFVLVPGQSFSFVDIDIKPSSDRNRIKINKKKKVNVAILSTGAFDATTQVDRDSLRFGRTGDEDSLIRKGKQEKPNCKKRDVNEDGLKDLQCKFSVQTADFQVGDTEGVLTGKTNDNVLFEGRDVVVIVTKNNEGAGDDDGVDDEDDEEGDEND